MGLVTSWGFTCPSQLINQTAIDLNPIKQEYLNYTFKSKTAKKIVKIIKDKKLIKEWEY